MACKTAGVTSFSSLMIMGVPRALSDRTIRHGFSGVKATRANSIQPLFPAGMGR
jgi:hypothetical protein